MLAPYCFLDLSPCKFCNPFLTKPLDSKTMSKSSSGIYAPFKFWLLLPPVVHVW